MELFEDPYDDLGKASKALKTVLDADEDTIEQLPPVERLMAHHIRKEITSHIDIEADRHD